MIPDGVAFLTLSDGPTYDYELVDIDTRASHTFELTNMGDVAATAIVPSEFGGPFGFVGGAFPGTDGDCETELAAGDTCSIAVEFAPTRLGPATASLAVVYNDGMQQAGADRPLTGGGAGSTGNLLMNGGAEDCAPNGTPSNWTIIDGDNWRCFPGYSGLNPDEGSMLFEAGAGSGQTDFSMRQDVDVSDYADLISAGVLRFAFRGSARSWIQGDDDYRIEVLYRDDALLEEFDTGSVSTSGWVDYEDERIAPSETEEIRVRISCTKPAGGDYCDGYFDNLRLVASYP